MCGLFSHSFHLFDEEPNVKKKMKHISFLENGKTFRNFDFTDSCYSKYVQVSDMFVGFLAKLFYFLDILPVENIKKIRLTLNKIQVQNFAIAYTLIKRSETKTPLFICNLNSMGNRIDRMKKIEILSTL